MLRLVTNAREEIVTETVATPQSLGHTLPPPGKLHRICATFRQNGRRFTGVAKASQGHIGA